MSTTPVILLVEDDESDVIFLKRSFQKIKLPYPVRVAETGQRAIRYLSGDGEFADRASFPLPTHILMDLKLPERSGIEVLEWIRTQPGLKDIKVAVLTSSSENRDLKRTRELGVECYLVKPMSFAVLIELARSIESWVRLGQCPTANRLSHEEVT